MAHHIARQMLGSDAPRGALLREELRQSFSAPTAGGELPPRAGASTWFTNPPVVFSEASMSRSHRGSREAGADEQESYVEGNFRGDGEDSEGLLHADDAVQDDSDDGVVTSQPLPPYVGMVFDTLNDAQKFYNDYAFKLGFGTHISFTKFNQKRRQKKEDAIVIKRVFECVHARKPGKAETSSTSESIATETSNSSRQASAGMDVTRTRQKNRMLRHDCKAHMIVGLRNERWTVTCFVAEHTHPLMKQPERVRYYCSHRKMPAEDYQLLLTLHDVNLSTSDCMGVLGRIHGGDTRILPYVKRDVSNERAKLRQGITFRDMDMTVKFFERCKKILRQTQ